MTSGDPDNNGTAIPQSQPTPSPDGCGCGAGETCGDTEPQKLETPLPDKPDNSGDAPAVKAKKRIAWLLIALAVIAAIGTARYVMSGGGEKEDE
jgi:hypothetical protein